MGDTDTDTIHRLHSSLATTSSSSSNQNPNFIPSPQFSTPSSNTLKRFGVPPTSPYSQIPTTRPGGATATHSRSLSQPSSFFSFDSLPPLSPSPFTSCNSTSSSRIFVGESLPPRKSHRRSNSDISNGLNSISGGECSDWSKTVPLVKKESTEEAMDDLFSAYMNLDTINDVLNSSEPDDVESSRASGAKTNGSDDTEGDITSVNYESGDHNNNLKRRARGGDIAPNTRHYRSVSVDSCFVESLSFVEDSLKPKNGEFTAVEMKKIMANDKLAEMAVSDPKRVKRILANRQSAARSKERKMRYIVELEHKVQTLQTEATTLSAQITLLQRDMMGLTNQNNELKFRLQAMEQQAQLRDALHEALTGEVQRLKLAIGKTSLKESNRSKMLSLNAERFQQLNISQLTQQPQSQHNPNGTMLTKPEIK